VLPWTAASVLVVLVALASQADRLMMGGNAPMRDLARAILARPDGDRVPVLAYHLRGHGLEFYLGRIIRRSTEDSDVVLSLRGPQLDRVGSHAGDLLDDLAGAPACVVLKTRPYESEAVFADWAVAGRAGSCVLVTQTLSRVTSPGPDGEGSRSCAVDPSRTRSAVASQAYDEGS
jgi:hypothetical protein